ncbi:MAG: hypothetical protein HY810_05820, partial [Candidatus Omnitrophica bacterium]|nr:hypothetical protein [Candidatus Omnitrophota bacterium]
SGGDVDKSINIFKSYELSTTSYVYDGDQIVAEYDGSGSLIRKYVYGQGIDEPICMETSNQLPVTRYYYHADGLGSIVALTDEAGNVAESYEYDAYGNIVIYDQTLTPIPQSLFGNSYMFTGRQFDSETGLYYYRARMYNVELGRFLQTDPVGYLVSMNLYSYCLNNPLYWIDPYGLDIWHILDRAGVTHAGAVVGQDGYYTYHSFQPEGMPTPIGLGDYEEKEFDSLEDAMDFARGKGYDEYGRYRTTKCEDEKAREAAREWEGDEYNVGTHNCQHMVNDMMWGANIPFNGMGHPWQTFKRNTMGLPNYDRGKL